MHPGVWTSLAPMTRAPRRIDWGFAVVQVALDVPSNRPTLYRHRSVHRIRLSAAAAFLTVACAPPASGPAGPAPTTAPATPAASGRGVGTPAAAPTTRVRPPAQPIDVVELTVAKVQTDLAAKKYTSAQLVQTYLDRIAMYEDHYNAFVSMNPHAMTEADALDKEFAAKGPRGPLHGVPVVVKDNIDMGGLVTTAGFAGFSKATGGIDMIPAQDAEAVARLKKAGAIVLGKTNMPDFAGNGTYSNSTVAGYTYNAYADNRAPGGSSGGTATAVNGSFAVFGLGTETGGSIQNPSSAQALVGVKGTFGLVPTHGVVPIDATYRDVVGPLARSVTDAAIALDVIAGPSLRDLASYSSQGRMPAKGYVASLSDTSLKGKRFGLVGPGWRRQYLPLAPETKALYDKAIAALKAQGAEVVEDPFLNSGWVELYGRIPRGASANPHDMFVYMQGLGPTSPFHTVQEWEALAGRTLTGGGGRGAPVAAVATESGDAYGAWRRDMRVIFRKVMADNRLDGLFFPQAGAPITTRVGTATPNNHPELPSNIINDVGLPTVTLPFAYYADGLPFTLAFIGDMWTDDKLLSWAYDLEQASKARVAPKLVPKAATPPGSR
jgi:amidase